MEMKVGAWWKECDLLLIKICQLSTNIILLASIYVYSLYLIVAKLLGNC